MSPTRRSILLGSGGIVAGASGVLATNRTRSSQPASEQPSDCTPTPTAEPVEETSTPDPEVTGEWTAYKHDAAHTGHAPETTGPRGNVEALWSKSVGRPIFCSPAVKDGHVFVGTYSYETHTGSILAFDAATGTTLWEKRTGRIHSSSPTVADGTLYINSGDGENPELVHAVDAATGDTLWTHEFEKGSGMRSSPTVVDGVVYATAELDNPDQDVTDVVVRALDAETGSQQWSTRIQCTALEYSSPAVVDGTVYHHIIPVDERDGLLFAFDAESGETEWKVLTSNMRGSPTIVDGVLYHSTGLLGGESTGLLGGGVVARDPATGEPLWKAVLEKEGEARFGPAVADGTVYATTADPGNVIAVDTDTGDVEWTFDTGEARGSPVVDSDTVYVPSWGDETVYALDADTGTERWHFDTGGSPYHPPAIVDGTIFVGESSGEGRFYAVRGESSP